MSRGVGGRALSPTRAAGSPGAVRRLPRPPPPSDSQAPHPVHGAAPPAAPPAELHLALPSQTPDSSGVCPRGPVCVSLVPVRRQGAPLRDSDPRPAVSQSGCVSAPRGHGAPAQRGRSPSQGRGLDAASPSARRGEVAPGGGRNQAENAGLSTLDGLLPRKASQNLG